MQADAKLPQLVLMADMINSQQGQIAQLLAFHPPAVRPRLSPQRRAGPGQA